VTQLPWMGLGLSTNLGPRDRPDPWWILDASPGAIDFVEYSAPLDPDVALAEAPRFSTLLERRHELPAIFHPVHLNLWGPALESEENLAALRAHLRQVGSPWVGNDVAWWHHRDAPFPGYLFVAPPFTRAGVEQAAAHAAHVQAAIEVPLLLENPAVLHRNGDLHVLDFMAALHARTGQPLLLDLGHLLAFQLVYGLEAEARLDGFPLEQVAEIHIAGGVITTRGARRFYVDDHGQPVREELFALLERILPRCTGLRAVTFEADGHPEPIALRTLERLRALVPRRREPQAAGIAAANDDAALEAPATCATASQDDGWGSAATAAPPGAVDGAAREAWRLFDLVHGAPADGVPDPDGLRAEVDFRLAVVAQRIDRAWPLTRAACAGDRAGLERFATSPEYRSLFDGSGRQLPAVFAAWARRVVREERLAGADAILAFESWCHGLLARVEAAPPGSGAIRLAPGVAVGSFPVDLSELLFAARTLRRHLADRAAAAGLYEGSGLEALRQIAARAAPGPWAVLLRRTGGAIAAEPLDPSFLRLVHLAARGATPADLPPADREALGRAVAAGVLVAGDR